MPSGVAATTPQPASLMDLIMLKIFDLLEQNVHSRCQRYDYHRLCCDFASVFRKVTIPGLTISFADTFEHISCQIYNLYRFDMCAQQGTSA
jgi:hypothetical protein